MTGMEQPDVADLLDIARETLTAELVPLLAADARFKALMIANALSIAARAARATPIIPPFDPEAICARIRSGAADNDTALARALLEDANARCRISSKQK